MNWMSESDSKWSKETPARNSCIRCKFERTCGYSTLANVMLKRRTESSYEPCPLGDKSYGNGPFFQLKRAA